MRGKERKEEQEDHTITVTAGILYADGRICICQRRSDAPFPLKWEFPGGKVEPGETLPAALHRELAEELAIEARIGPELCRLTYQYPSGLRVHLIFFVVREYRGEIKNRAFAAIRWVTKEELTEFDFLEADQEIIKQISTGALPLIS